MFNMEILHVFFDAHFCFFERQLFASEFLSLIFVGAIIFSAFLQDLYRKRKVFVFGFLQLSFKLFEFILKLWIILALLLEKLVLLFNQISWSNLHNRCELSEEKSLFQCFFHLLFQSGSKDCVRVDFWLFNVFSLLRQVSFTLAFWNWLFWIRKEMPDVFML